MAVVFAVRGDSFNARYAGGRKDGTAIGGFSIAADGGAISGSTILAAANNNVKSVLWSGRRNTPNGRAISILMRFMPGYSGTPAANRLVLPCLLASGGRVGRIEVVHNTAGNIVVTLTNEAGVVIANATSVGAWVPVAATMYDVVFTWDGTATANSAKVYVDAVLMGQFAPSAAFTASWSNLYFGEISLSGGVAVVTQNATAIDEIVIWDTVIDPTAVTLDSGSGSLNGVLRVSPVTAASFEGGLSTDPGIANVKTGTGYTINGVALTGTLVSTTGGGKSIALGTRKGGGIFL